MRPKNAPKNGRHYTLHRDRSVTLWDGFFWLRVGVEYSDLLWVRKAVQALPEIDRKRINRHFGV